MNLIRLLAVFLLFNVYSVQADETLESLIQQGQQNIATGHYREAETQLQQAHILAVEQENAYHATLIQGLQGYIAFQRQNSSAEKILLEALKQAQSSNWSDLTARIQLYLAQLNYRAGSIKTASEYFKEIIAHTNQINDKPLLVSTFYQFAKLTRVYYKAEDAFELLEQAQTLLEKLPPNETSCQLWLNLGYQALELYHEKNTQEDYLRNAYHALNTALTQARQFEQPRIEASALKHLAVIYNQQKRHDDAVKLMEEAINIAQKEDASDLLIDLEWQLGKLYKAENNYSGAIGAYRQAVAHIEKIRLDIPVSYEQGRSSFRDTLAPIYLELADLLLQNSASDSSQQQTLLKEAQDTIEKLKKSELEDFFQSRCEIAAKPIDLKKTDPHAAAVYPIQLPERLDIIVYTSDGLHRFSSDVTAKDLEQTARAFSTNLRNYADFEQSKSQAQLMYQWLISPAQALLKEKGIETLVYIPDGALRLFPLGALYDGHKFLIEDYAIVTSPGMSLIESETETHEQKDILLAGMSKPGDVIYDLPQSILADFVAVAQSTEQTELRGVTRDLKRWLGNEKKRELSVSETAQQTKELQELLKKPEISNKIQELLALPGVDAEVKNLADQNGMPYILNEDFSLDNFTETLTGEPHKILHIASHGFFGSTAEDSFIMTHDKILNISKLEQLLGMEHFRRFPIDLITLSACQTAEGDDRSPLGISGVAIKSKVHSALGSLWPVADEATAQLMTTFYQLLKEPEFSKAKALRKAKLDLLKGGKFANPSFWSPFILVGNWQ